MTKPLLTLYLAAPRGFCAGVDRAIKIVEMALEKWGAPVYVRHEIVHNKFVVDGLRDKGAVFVEELSEWVAMGELALDGRIVASPGVLLAALHASEQEKGLICPAAQGAEARWASGISIFIVASMSSRRCRGVRYSIENGTMLT